MSLRDLAVGETVFTASYPVTRADLVAYADASGDHNPIHQDEAAAKAAGLPDVIAHGMYTMGLVSRAVLEWAADSGIDARLTDFSARFAKPVIVPAAGGTTVEVEAKVRNLDEHSVELAMTVTSAGEKVLAPARATLAAK
ncbi:MaoC family dehydratase N-terminal domain-containing protein [Glycomyces sp. TRM65418]|uniref:MaoC/PaaZ C-terminal domain-containing protein n=1 Tax=Glycomyces sp. TRM65418 TaxID=2867006 RepID=UPI001CE4EE83|nr:MaoC/PaaZ C-terminal domain-containing protein [Glycomyces sp. TRM65418]MCC3763734.1 MaoC family dehydratase N-terminal domain-containing protein [Glycomyces sp. TRM65418]QZD53446.1 MaoC family dehydratase N-terminal domain-containing protein [Glycomyces sp. TRM65418]